MYKDIRKIQDADVKGKTVVVRANFDVPLDEYGDVLDNTRLASVVKTVHFLLENECKVILISHLGRPGGEKKDDMSLLNVRFELGKLLDKPVKFAHITACENSIKFMEQGEIILIENVRFHPEEESDNEFEQQEFMKTLAELCDIYVTDDFGTYRPSASTFVLPQLLPSYAGFHLQKEIESLNKLKEESKSPFVAILGGAKIDTKLPLVEALIHKVDKILIGGALAYTFMEAEGILTGKSKTEKDKVDVAKRILSMAKENNTEIVLPIDHVCGEEFEEDTKPIEVETQQIPDNLMGLDIGEKTLRIFREILESAETILWNGPMGVFEWDNFNRGTEAVGEYIALSAPKQSYKVAGGGDTTLALNTLRIKQKRFDHISIGGGMLIKFIAGENFPVLDIFVGKQDESKLVKKD